MRSGGLVADEALIEPLAAVLAEAGTHISISYDFVISVAKEGAFESGKWDTGTAASNMYLDMAEEQWEKMPDFIIKQAH